MYHSTQQILADEHPLRLSEIPKIIHQVWFNFSDSSSGAAVPQHLQQRQATWHAAHPTWKHLIWTDDDANRLLTERYPDSIDLFKTYKQPIERVDAIRYFILHAFGGIYVDMDTECVAPLDPLCNSSQLVLMEKYDTSRLARKNVDENIADSQQLVFLSNYIIGSVSKHPFMEHCIRLLHQRRENLPFKLIPNWKTSFIATMTMAGPLFLTYAYNSYRKRIETEKDYTHKGISNDSVSILKVHQFDNIKSDAQNNRSTNVLKGKKWGVQENGKEVHYADTNRIFGKHYFASSWGARKAIFIDCFRLLGFGAIVLCIIILASRIFKQI